MNIIFSLLAFFLPFSVYFLTLAPTITHGDNPELIAAAYSLGVPHPPGYPLFCLLGKIFSLLPLGTVAFRINLMSAVAGAAAVMILYLILEEIFDDPVCAFAASLCLAFSRVFWLYSVQAEVFALNNLLLALILWAAIKRNWRLSLFFLGLGLANQQSLILVLPALTYYFKENIKANYKNLKKIATALLLFSAGLFFYAYLPVVAFLKPFIYFGNPSNLKNFFLVVTRTIYSEGRTYQLPINIINSFPAWPFNLFWYFRYLIKDFSLFSVFIGLVGGFYLRKNNRRIFYFSTIAWFFLGSLILLANLEKFDTFQWTILERLILEGSLPLVIWLAAGFCFIKSYLKLALRPVFLLLPLFLAGINFSQCNYSHYFYGSDLAGNILRSLPPKTILLVNTDTPFFHLLYQQIVEQQRPDVKVLFRTPANWQTKQYRQIFPELNFSNSMNNIQKFPLPPSWLVTEDFFICLVLNNYQKYPVAITNPSEIFSYNIIPFGIICRIFDDEQMKKLTRQNSPENQKLAALEQQCWQSYHKQGLYSLEKVSPQTKNLIFVYREALFLKAKLRQ